MNLVKIKLLAGCFWPRRQNFSAGFTLMEVLVSLFIIMVLTLGIYSMIILSLQLTADNQHYVEAIAIANQKMERIRNMPYSDVGVVGGIPSGILPQVETVNREGNFTVNTYVTYYDDDYDSLAGSSTPDTIPNDYKIATVKVGWQSKMGPKHVIVFSKIIPRTVETFEGYGLLKIYVGNASAQPVANADVRVVNNKVTPAIDVTNPTGSDGILYLPATSSYQGYEITVTKTDQEWQGIYYGVDQTYDPSTSKSPFHLTVTAGDMTEEAFTIDRLATLRIRTVSTNLPDNWQVNKTQIQRNQVNVGVSPDSSDNMYFVWQSRTATSSFVYAQKYNVSQVRQWSNDYKISNTKFQLNPDIVTTAAGNSFVVWQDNSTSLKLITRHVPSLRLAEAGGRKKMANSGRISLTSDFIYQTVGLPAGAGDKAVVFWGNNFSAAGDFYRRPLSKIFPFSFYGNGGLFNNAVSGVIDFLAAALRPSAAQAGASTVTTVGVSPGTTTGNTATITLSAPAGVQAGDLLLAFIHHDDASDGPMVPPAGFGWQVLNDNLNPSGSRSDSRGGIWWKVAAVGDPANYTFTISGGNEQKAGHIRAYRGVDTANPFDGNLETHSTAYNSVFHPAPSHTVSNDGSMLVCGWGADTYTLGNAAGGPTFPAGMGNTRYNFAPYITAAAADEPVDIADSPTGTRTYDANKTVTQASMDWSLVLRPLIVPDDVTVSAVGSQTSSTTIPSASFYLGGAFVLVDDTGAHTVNSITISEDGSVDGQNNLSNIKLLYDLDTAAPYDCVSESYSGGEPQFGGVDADGFSAANGTSTFSGSVDISTTQTMCVYVVLDVDVGASAGQTIEIKINNPSTDVVLAAGNVIPGTPVELPDTTTLNQPAELRQVHYRWRNDDGTEAGASWKEDEDEATTITAKTVIRLRFSVANGGSLPSDAVQYRLEYGKNTGNCGDITVWTALPFDNSAHWRMATSSYFSDGDATTDSPGLTDENSTFQPGEMKETSSQTGAITLAADEFTEIEYALAATDNVTDSPYCFRLTNAGSTADFNYLSYPQISVVGDDNIYIVSLDANGNELWSVKRVNRDIAGENQTNPKIALTENFGQATTTVVWVDGRNGNLDIYGQILDADGNKILAGDLQITGSSTDEYSPDIVFDSNDNFFVVWTEDAAAGESIYLQRYNLGDQSHWPQSRQVVNSSFDTYAPAIAIDASDNLYLAYTENAAGIKNVYLAKYDSNGNLLWENQANLEEAAFDQYSPAVAVRGSYVYVSWTDDREGNEDIYTQKYDLNGSAQWTEDLRVNINTGTSTQSYSTLLINSAGDPFAAWEDDRSGNYDIYATQFNDPGVISGVGNVPIRVWGTKTISETPVVYEFDQSQYTDASGYAILSVEWDTGYYSELVSASTSLNIVWRDPVQPLPLMPAETKDWLIYVE